MAEEPTTTGGATPPSPQPPVPGQAKGKTPESPEEKKGGVSEAFSGLRVSLVPKELLGQDGPDLKLRILIAVMILILETGGVLVGHYFLNKIIKNKEAQKTVLMQQFNEVKLEAERQEQEMRDAIVFSKQMKVTEGALDGHFYATEVIKFIESNTLPNVKYNRVQVNLVTGVIGIDVIALKFRSIAEQIVYLKSLDEVLQLRNSAVTADVDDFGVMEGVNASLVLKLDSSIWVGHKTTLSLKQK
jgi:hypothetical protein